MLPKKYLQLRSYISVSYNKGLPTRYNSSTIQHCNVSFLSSVSFIYRLLWLCSSTIVLGQLTYGFLSRMIDILAEIAILNAFRCKTIVIFRFISLCYQFMDSAFHGNLTRNYSIGTQKTYRISRQKRRWTFPALFAEFINMYLQFTCSGTTAFPRAKQRRVSPKHAMTWLPMMPMFWRGREPGDQQPWF